MACGCCRFPGGPQGRAWSGWELPGQVAKGWCLHLGEGVPTEALASIVLKHMPLPQQWRL